MLLKETMKSSGNWLFRWRSFLPLILVVLVIFAFKNYHYPYQSHRLDLIWEMGCLSISFLGLAIRFITVGSTPKGTSGRETKLFKAEVLNTTGMYSIVRHPLYLGNFIIGLGISLFFRLWWITILFMAIFWLYYERIIFAEEEFLLAKFGSKYLEWSKNTPTFLPKIQNWTFPTRPFSFRTALRKEYRTFMAIIATFTFLEVAGDFSLHRRLGFDFIWISIFIISTSSYFIIRIIDKKTRILRVDPQTVSVV